MLRADGWTAICTLNADQLGRGRVDRSTQEPIDELIQSKQELADEILGKSHEGERMLIEMADRDLLNFVALAVRNCEV